MSGLFSDTELGKTEQTQEQVSTENVQEDVQSTESSASTEDVQSTNTEETTQQTQEQQTQSTEQAPEWSFSAEDFNKSFGTEFADDTALKDYLAKAKQTATEHESLQNKYNELNVNSAEMESKFSAIVDKIKANDLYASDDVAKLNALIKENPNTDLSMLSNIMFTDLDSKSDMDVAILHEQYKHGSGLDYNTAKIMLKRELGIEDMEELTTEDLAVIKSKALQAKGEFNKIKNVETAKAFDLDSMFNEAKQAQESLKAKMSEKWKPAMDSLNKINDITAKVKDFEGNDIDFAFEFGDGSKTLTDENLQALVNFNVEPTEENVAAINNLKQAFAVYANLPKILNTHTQQELTKAKQKWQAEVNNDQTFNTQSRQGNVTANEVKEASEGLDRILTKPNSGLF